MYVLQDEQTFSGTTSPISYVNYLWKVLYIHHKTLIRQAIYVFTWNRLFIF